jgi:hypothetical protein
MVETMEHIFAPDRLRALCECQRVLRRGGCLVFSTPNYQSVVERFKRFAVKHPWVRKRMPAMCYPEAGISRSAYHPYRYHQPSPDQEICNLLEKANFRVKKVKRYLFALKNTPDWLFPVVLTMEKTFERFPGLRRFAATTCFIAEK